MLYEAEEVDEFGDLTSRAEVGRVGPSDENVGQLLKLERADGR